MKNEKDPSRKAVLDGRQLALKISANSVYVVAHFSLLLFACARQPLRPR